MTGSRGRVLCGPGSLCPAKINKEISGAPGFRVPPSLNEQEPRMIEVRNEHGYAGALVVWARDPDAEGRCEDPTQLRVHQMRKLLYAAQREFERAVLDRVGKLVRDVYPSAAKLVYDGNENEDGLLHTYVQQILDADDNVLDSQYHPSDNWEELIDQRVEPVLWEVSERDHEYYGEGKILELEAT